MGNITEGELLELAQEAFALFRELKEYKRSFFVNWDTEQKIRDSAWLKVAEFEQKYAKRQIGKR